MSILPSWPIAAAALVAGFAGGFAVEHTRLGAKIDRINAAHAEQERVRQVQRAADEVAARKKEQGWAEKAGQIEQEKTYAIAKIRTDYDTAVARLQQRADRKPAPAGGVPAPSPACAGSTGAELSRQDGEFLAGEAARADELRAALSACYGWAGVVNRSTEATTSPRPTPPQ